jgi:protocatechuate 3,4-dioxygenase beta subunit
MGKVFAVALTPATLHGTVTDSAAAAGLNGVRVHARRLDPTPKVRTAVTTDDSGQYSLRNLSPGRYRVLFLRGGYRPQLRHVELPVGGMTTLDMQLRPR